MNKRFIKYSILSVLIIIFLAPGLAAYFFYKNPHYLGPSKINKGELLKPVLHINLQTSRHWKLIYSTPSFCGSSCLEELERLYKIRLALGRKFYDVEQWLFLLDENAMTARNRLLLTQKGIRIYLPTSNEHNSLVALGTKVFIANPSNYLILSYSRLKSINVYTDLKLLLSRD